MAAGLPAAAATQISNILSNCAQTLKHAGVIEHDKTPAALRMVTPEVRRQQLPNLDFRQADPDYRSPATPESEERQAPQQAPAVEASQAPQQTTSTFRVAGGPFVAAEGAGEAVRVGLRVQGFGRIATLDPPNNSIVGKTIRAASGSGDSDFVRFFIEETGQEIVFNIQLQNVVPYDVVTGLHYEDGVGLVVQSSRLYAWRNPAELPTARTIPVTGLDVVTDVRLESSGVSVLRSRVQAFEFEDIGGGLIPVDSCDAE